MSKNRFFSILTLLVFVLSVTGAMAAPNGKSLETIKNEASADFRVAVKLVREAQTFLSRGRTRETLKAAMDLYIRAGQLFEKSENAFRAAGDRHASPEDVALCARSKEKCVFSVQKIKEALSRP